MIRFTVSILSNTLDHFETNIFKTTLGKICIDFIERTRTKSTDQTCFQTGTKTQRRFLCLFLQSDRQTDGQTALFHRSPRPDLFERSVTSVPIWPLKHPPRVYTREAEARYRSVRSCLSWVIGSLRASPEAYRK